MKFKTQMPKQTVKPYKIPVFNVFNTLCGSEIKLQVFNNVHLINLICIRPSLNRQFYNDTLSSELHVGGR